ncbi:Arabinose operon regulatory protein [Klebsiella pneumoniae]|nr:Arabinose operon regulatory protein [Klebsiella pneumoniae]
MELDINELLNFSPLMKTFTFNAWVVAGFTPITRGSTLDYYINRPQGMKGYIINLTLRGQARAKAGDGFLLCRENDLLLFPPGVPIITAGTNTASTGTICGSTLSPAPTG